MTLPQAMGSGPLARPLSYQYKRTVTRAEPLRHNGSMQSGAMGSGPGLLISKANKFGLNRPAPTQPREQTWGITPAPCRWPAAKPPQPRESGYAYHPQHRPRSGGRRRLTDARHGAAVAR
jgi:hypothetical protein